MTYSVGIGIGNRCEKCPGTKILGSSPLSEGLPATIRTLSTREPRRALLRHKLVGREPLIICAGLSSPSFTLAYPSVATRKSVIVLEAQLHSTFDYENLWPSLSKRSSKLRR